MPRIKGPTGSDGSVQLAAEYFEQRMGGAVAEATGAGNARRQHALAAPSQDLRGIRNGKMRHHLRVADATARGRSDSDEAKPTGYLAVSGTCSGRAEASYRTRSRDRPRSTSYSPPFSLSVLCSASLPKARKHWLLIQRI